MQELRANTEVKVRVGSFPDVGDGFTPQVDIALSGNEAELLKHNGVATVDISARTWAAITNVRGWYDLTLTTTDTNTEGMLTVVVQDDSDCLPVHRDFMVLSEAAWDSKYLAKDDGFMDVNIKTIGRADTQETEANNLESACSNYSATRGLTGTAVPAAAADGVGGMPISDAGGLDLDTKLANTNEITAARMGALTDWINGGRLDLLIDDILLDTGTTLDALIKDIPTTAELALRTLLAADYTVVGDLGIVQSGDSFTIVNGAHGLVSIQDDIDLLVARLTAVRAGYLDELAAANIPADIDTLLTRITALIATKAEMDTAHALLATPAQVNTQVLDVLNTDTFAEPGDEVPAATTTLVNKIGYLYKFLRNKIETKATKIHVYNDAGANKDHSSVISDDGTTFTRGKFGAGDA